MLFFTKHPPVLTALFGSRNGKKALTRLLFPLYNKVMRIEYF